MTASEDPWATRAPTLLDIVTLACLAPSVHNTQPWTWRVGDSSLELYADRRRLLPVSDPSGHQLILSCGTALHHAQVAALGLGWRPQMVLLPDGPSSDLLARMALTPTGRAPRDVAAMAVLRERRTDRRRFTSWPVPEGRLRRLAMTAEKWGVIATTMVDVSQRAQVETLLGRAHELQSHDHRLEREQSAWVDHGSRDGVPATVVPARSRREVSRRSRFGPGLLEDADREVDTTDALMVLSSVSDNRLAWLRAGEALSALWLDATTQGLTVVPLSQLIEVPETRSALQSEVLVSMAAPQILLRVGWPAITRTALPPVPHRLLEDVISR